MTNGHKLRASFSGALVGGLLVGASVFCGCDVGKDLPSSTSSAGKGGSIQFALSLPDGTSISSVAYKVVSSSGTVVGSGSVNTTGGRTPSFITSLAPAKGDTVSLVAVTGAGVTCSGMSAPFDVTSGGLVTVAVDLFCSNVVSSDAGTLGSLVVTGHVVPGDNCPVLAGWFITPQETVGSSPVDVSVMAADADSADTLTYAWTATSGSFANPKDGTTQYTCAATGPQTLSVTISDGHAPTPCTTQITFPAVTCD
jgi:hypothetical protein